MTSESHPYPSAFPDRPILPDLRQSHTLPTRYVELAHQTLTDACRESVESSRFLLIVESALKALHLVFTAALDEPIESELDFFFETFVRACLAPCLGGQR